MYTIYLPALQFIFLSMTNEIHRELLEHIFTPSYCVFLYNSQTFLSALRFITISHANPLTKEKQNTVLRTF